MRLAVLFTLAFVSVFPVTAATRPLTPSDTRMIDEAATTILARTAVPSASIAIVEHGRIVYAKAYGMRAPGAPAAVTARYPIASVSKQFLATAILKLADEHRLSLDDKVGKYLPTLAGANRITIRQLLNHSSGYRDYWPQDYSFAAMRTPVTPMRILDRWAKAPLDFAPGTRHQYSNTGYVAAGLIVETVTGEPLIDYYRRTFFRPLGMTSAVDADIGMTGADATPNMRYALGPVRPERPAAAGWLYAAGPLAMTASDLARWDIATLDAQLLSPAAYRAQFTPLVLPDGEDTHYGLGVEIDDEGGHARISHGGEAVGFLSDNRIYPEDGAAIVVLVNGDFGDAQSAIADRIEQTILPQSGETARARAIFAGLRAGRIDRGRFTANANDYFTPTALADYRTSLASLGEPQGFVQTSSRLRGGFTAELYRITYPDRRLTLVVRAEPGENGKIEQFMVYPAS